MKNVVLVLCFATLANICAAQSRLGYIDTVSAERPFYYHYVMCGLGSNIGSMMPNMTITRQTLICLDKQNSYHNKPDKEPDTICVVTISKGAVDSIVGLVRGLKDSSYFNWNRAIMSGIDNYLIIATGADTVTYHLTNTANEITWHSLEIINPYLPAEHRFSDSR